MKPVVLILAVLIVMMALAFVTAWDYPDRQARLLPLMLSGTAIILAITVLIKELRTTKHLPAPSTDTQVKTEPVERRRFLVESAWVVGFVIAVFLLGLLVATFSFAVTYARSRGARWLVSIILAVCTSGTIWLVSSSYVLDFRLYPGLIPRLLGTEWLVW